MTGNVRLLLLSRKNTDSIFEFIAMELLHQHSATGAFHNSDERYDPPKCHPHTRRAVLKKIMDWVKNPNKVALFLWLYGPAGAGKSAIAQTIAELLEKAGLLAAAFFFSRNVAGRNDKTRLVATLVYQLVKSIPEIRAHVLGAVERDLALFSYSIEAQIQALIVKPLNAAANEEALTPMLLSRPRLIILDGLDECSTTSAQSQIVNALSTAAKHLHIPLFFIIASRPEQDIRQSFNGLGSRSFSIALDDTYRPDDDIQVFLQSTFYEIKQNHPSRAHLPMSWPSFEDTQRLVEKSSGQFIFASTVAKYVNSHRHWPPDRLNIILGKSKPSQETPFAELDSLYHLILSSVADAEKFQDVLMLLVLRPFWQGGMSLKQTTTLIEKFLFYRPGEIDMILTDLHSIIYVPPPGIEISELHFFHASLPDFLLDQSRSMHLFLDQGTAYAKLTRLAVKHINNPTESPLRDHQGMCFPFCYDFIDSMRMKTVFMAHSGGVASKLVHPRSSLRTCAR